MDINIPFISDSDLTLDYHDMLSSDFKDNHPDIRVYRWTNNTSSGRITISPDALYINKLDDCDLTMLCPTVIGGSQYYVSTSYDELRDICKEHECEVNKSREASDKANEVALNAGTGDLITNGATLSHYCMAPIVTGEYYQANGRISATIVAYLTNRVSLMEAIS